MNTVKRHPGAALMVLGGLAWIGGLLTSGKFKGYERFALIAASLGAAAEAFRAWKT